MRVWLSFGFVLCVAASAACSSDDDAPAPARDAGSRQDPEKSDAGANRDAGDSDGADASQDDEKPAVSCDAPAPTACVEPKPGYMSDVAPILKERCVLCHNGAAGGPWPLTTYGHVADWQIEIRDQVSHCTMPPADAGVPITNDERAKILMWIRCGMQR